MAEEGQLYAMELQGNYYYHYESRTGPESVKAEIFVNVEMI